MEETGLAGASAPGAPRVVYIVATGQGGPIDPSSLAAQIEGEDVQIHTDGPGLLFSVQSESSRVDVDYSERSERLGWTPDLLVGSAELKARLAAAVGFYRIACTPGQPAPSVAVFEALWTLRMLLEQVEDGVVVDVTAFKLHSRQDVEEITELDFDIRDHLTIHAMETGGDRLWVHTHGLSKFGQPEVEVFNVAEEDLSAAEMFLHELCTDLAFGNGPKPRAPVFTSVGRAFMLLTAEDARATLVGVDHELFEGHGGAFVTVVDGDGKHTVSDILAQYRDRFELESTAETQALQSAAEKLLPAFKARFQRKGLMEPMTFLVRAPFEVHPQGETEGAEKEDLWAEVVAWHDESLVGRLVDGGYSTTEWRKGAHVEIDDDQINALSLATGGRRLEPPEVEELLLAERPA